VHTRTGQAASVVVTTRQSVNAVKPTKRIVRSLFIKVYSSLTKKAEPPPTRDVNRDSRTVSANGGWLRRLVRPQLHVSIQIIRPILKPAARQTTSRGLMSRENLQLGTPTESAPSNRINLKSPAANQARDGTITWWCVAQRSRDGTAPTSPNSLWS